MTRSPRIDANRRTVLKSLGAVSIIGISWLAGCADEGDGGGAGDGGVGDGDGMDGGGMGDGDGMDGGDGGDGDE